MEDMISHFKIIEKIGEGGMSIVYKAFDTRLNRTVALKIIQPREETDPYFLKRFEREAKALALLNHPNIAHILEFGDHEGRPFLVMEYFEGGSLASKIGNPIPFQEAAAVILPIARALEYAHKKGIVHRDIKPANIMFTYMGEPMISDFGLVKLLEREDSVKLTRAGAGIGTPEYVAPEQSYGEDVDQRADIYSLGVVLYEMVTGRKPFSAASPMEIFIKKMKEPPPSPRSIIAEIPPEVERVILKTLEKKPEDRYADMGSFIQAIENIRDGIPESVDDLPHEDQLSPVIQPEEKAQISGNLPDDLLEKVDEPHEPDSVIEAAPKNESRKYLWFGAAGCLVLVLLCLGALCLGTILLLMMSSS